MLTVCKPQTFLGALCLLQTLEVCCAQDTGTGTDPQAQPRSAPRSQTHLLTVYPTPTLGLSQTVSKGTGLTCLSAGSCEVNEAQRRHCPACSWLKCLGASMKDSEFPSHPRRPQTMSLLFPAPTQRAEQALETSQMTSLSGSSLLRSVTSRSPTRATSPDSVPVLSASEPHWVWRQPQTHLRPPRSLGTGPGHSLPRNVLGE